MQPRSKTLRLKTSNSRIADSSVVADLTHGQVADSRSSQLANWSTRRWRCQQFVSRANFRPGALATVALENCRRGDWTWISESGPRDGSDESSGSAKYFAFTGRYYMDPLKWLMPDSSFSLEKGLDALLAIGVL